MPRSVPVSEDRKVDRDDKDKGERNQTRWLKQRSSAQRHHTRLSSSSTTQRERFLSPRPDPRVASVAFIPTSESSRRAIAGQKCL